MSSNLLQEEINYGRSCITPNGERGFCVDLLECKSNVFLLVKTKTNPDNAEYLRRSKCGGNGTNVTACCPLVDLREDLDGKATRLLPSRTVCTLQSAQSVSSDKITKLNEFPWTVQIFYSMLFLFDKNLYILDIDMMRS